MIGILASVAILYYALPWPYSLIRSKILGKDAADGSSLTEVNISAKVCGLLCPVSSLTRIVVGACPACRGFTLYRPGASRGSFFVWTWAVGVRPCPLAHTVWFFHLLLGIYHPGLFKHCLKCWCLCDLYCRFASWSQRPDPGDQVM